MLTIFISYGHNDDLDFSGQLADFLRSKGHKVWYDKEDIKLSNIWERKITKGLNFVKNANTEGRFMYIMTPKSIGEKGFCLNELAYALYLHIQIVPIRLKDVRPPLSIFRYQYMDCLSFPTYDEKDREQLFNKIHEAILTNDLDTYGDHSSLMSKLSPIDFRGDLSFLLMKHKTREWVEEEIDRWLKTEEAPRVMCIVGGPGYGKSSIAAHLIHGRNNIIAFHLCKKKDSEKSDIKKIIQTLACQISTQFEEYESQLSEITSDPKFSEWNNITLFERLICIPLLNIKKPDISEGNKVILIDALDESATAGNESIQQIVMDNADRLPDWIRFIVTTRPIDEVTSQFKASRLLNLEDSKFKSHNNKDLKDYLDHELSKFQNEENLEKAKKIILEKSEGTFLYVATICNDIRNSILNIDDAEAFPASISNYYTEYFKRINFTEQHRNFLSVMLAAKELLTIDMISTSLEVPIAEIHRIVSQFGSMIRIDENNVLSFFHTSLSDWLQDREKSASYHIDTTAGHQILAKVGIPDNCLREYQIKNLPKHLAYLGKLQEMTDLYNDESYVNEFREMESRQRNDSIVQICFDNFSYAYKHTGYLSHSVFKSALFRYLLEKFGGILFDKTPMLIASATR